MSDELMLKLKKHVETCKDPECTCHVKDIELARDKLSEDAYTLGKEVAGAYGFVLKPNAAGKFEVTSGELAYLCASAIAIHERAQMLKGLQCLAELLVEATEEETGKKADGGVKLPGGFKL